MKRFLEEGDIVCTRGETWLSRAIRAFSRVRGEEPTQINHVGIVTKRGPLWLAELTEALWRVRTHLLWKRYGKVKTQKVAVFRAKNIDEETRKLIARYALVTYQNRPYGVLKIVLHAADRAIGGRYFFRKIGRLKKYPICSFLVADAYEQFGFDFGVPAGQAQPDDIWDYCVSRPDYYEIIRPLKVLK